MNIDFIEILKELEFRVHKGIIDLTKEEQVTELVNILRENGISDANQYAQRARVIFSFVTEADDPLSKADKALNQTVINKDTNNPVLVSTALGYKNKKGKGAQKAYQDAKAIVAKAGASPEEIEKLTGEKQKRDKKEKPVASTIKVSDAEKRADEKDKRKKPVRTEAETKKQKLNDETFVSIIKNGLIPTQKKELSGAGVFSMTKDQAKHAVDFYTKRIENPDYQLPLPRYDVSEEKIDEAIDIMKKELGPSFSRVFASIQKAGGVDPKLTTGEAGKQRARDIIKLYLSFGGRSVVTGKVVPFNQMQLDHRIPYSSAAERVKEKQKKGIKTTLLEEQDDLDSPHNWDLIETPINQQKNALTGNELVEKLARTANMSDDEIELRQIKQELANIYETELLKGLVKSFGKGDYSGMNTLNIQNMTGEEIDVVMKAWNYWHPNTRDAANFRKADPNYDSILKKAGIDIPPPDNKHTIQRGQSQEGGSRSRGIKWPVPIRKELTIKAMKSAKVLTTKSEAVKTNLVLLKAIDSVKKMSKDKEQRAAELSKKIKQQQSKKK